MWVLDLLLKCNFWGKPHFSCGFVEITIFYSQPVTDRVKNELNHLEHSLWHLLAVCLKIISVRYLCRNMMYFFFHHCETHLLNLPQHRKQYFSFYELWKWCCPCSRFFQWSTLTRNGEVFEGASQSAAALQTRSAELRFHWLAVRFGDEASCVLFST